MVRSCCVSIVFVAQKNMLDVLQSAVKHGHRNRELLLTRKKVWTIAKRERPGDVKIWLHEALKEIAEEAGWKET